MLIECLIERVGPTTVTLGKVTYTFMPILRFDGKGKRIEQTTSCCEVNSEEHVKHLLARGQYREYVPEQKPAEVPVNTLARYSFEKHMDGTANAGYIVVDSVGKRFAGANGWQPDRKALSPFTSEYEAFEWLKAEAEGEADVPSGFPCKQCGEVFPSPQARTEHHKEKHPKG
jgi:hypothetical protein